MNLFIWVFSRYNYKMAANHGNDSSDILGIDCLINEVKTCMKNDCNWK